MDPGDRRDAFLDHLSESEERLGARRNSVFDALVIGLIALIIAGGFTLGVMRLRTPIRAEQANRPDTAAPVSASPATPGGPPTAMPTPPGKDGRR